MAAGRDLQVFGSLGGAARQLLRHPLAIDERRRPAVGFGIRVGGVGRIDGRATASRASFGIGSPDDFTLSQPAFAAIRKGGGARPDYRERSTAQCSAADAARAGIVEAILDGWQPVGMRLEDLMEWFPLEWEAQVADVILRPEVR